VEIDTENLTGLNGSDEIMFTRREIEVLAYLARNADRPVSREELLSIEVDAKAPERLITIRGAGYRLVMEH
jgi:two-component system response regulator RegX3